VSVTVVEQKPRDFFRTVYLQPGIARSRRCDKGWRMMEILQKRLGGFLLELADSELDESFPF